MNESDWAFCEDLQLMHIYYFVACCMIFVLILICVDYKASEQFFHILTHQLFLNIFQSMLYILYQTTLTNCTQSNPLECTFPLISWVAMVIERRSVVLWKALEVLYQIEASSSSSTLISPHYPNNSVFHLVRSIHNSSPPHSIKTIRPAFESSHCALSIRHTDKAKYQSFVNVLNSRGV